MLNFSGRETAEYVRCGDDPARKTANKLFSSNECSSKEARGDKGKDKGSLMKAWGVGWGGCIAHRVLPKVALASLRDLLQTVYWGIGNCGCRCKGLTFRFLMRPKCATASTKWEYSTCGANL